MSTVTFDTLKFVKTLEANGFDSKQAEAIASAYRDATNEQDLITKEGLKFELQSELAPIKTEMQAMKTEMQVMKWMNSLVLGGIIILILKSFF